MDETAGEDVRHAAESSATRTPAAPVRPVWKTGFDGPAGAHAHPRGIARSSGYDRGSDRDVGRESASGHDDEDAPRDTEADATGTGRVEGLPAVEAIPPRGSA